MKKNRKCRTEHAEPENAQKRKPGPENGGPTAGS